MDSDLTEMVEWSRAHESRMGYFAALYTHVEKAIANALAEGAFDHPALLVKVNETFFGRYRDAFDERLRRAPTTGVWKATFDATQSNRLCVVQHLLLGMNAHINFDLAIAVADALEPEQVPTFQADFNRMNALLASLVNEVCSDVALVWGPLTWINRLAGGPEDLIINFSMRYARDHAWRSAIQLSALTGSARAAAIIKLDSVAVGLAYDVAHPDGFLAAMTVAIIRLGERGTVADIIDDMLD
jgi:hypothetical protein